jgi:ubiquitin-protein ligase
VLTYDQRKQQIEQRQAISSAILRTLGEIVRKTSSEDDSVMLRQMIVESCLLNVYHTQCYNVAIHALCKQPQIYHALAFLAVEILQHSLLQSLLDVRVRNVSFKALLLTLERTILDALENDEFSELPDPADFDDRFTAIVKSLQILVPREIQDAGSQADMVLGRVAVTAEERYVCAIQPHVFAMCEQIEMFETHCYFKDACSENASLGNARQKRVLRELRALPAQLPVHFGSTIAVRVCEDHPHVMRALIAAPVNTPYDSGCFEFHIYCGASYPSQPPKVHFLTTGYRTGLLAAFTSVWSSRSSVSVRFNPNLYDSGYVCLSLLGTWAGRAEEVRTSITVEERGYKQLIL